MPHERLTAEQARALAGPSVTDRVNVALGLIRDAATQKKRRVNLHDDFWVREGYSGTADYKAACQQLAELGYKVSYHYQEGSIAVDMYTYVEW